MKKISIKQFKYAILSETLYAEESVNWDGKNKVKEYTIPGIYMEAGFYLTKRHALSYNKTLDLVWKSKTFKEFLKPYKKIRGYTKVDSVINIMEELDWVDGNEKFELFERYIDYLISVKLVKIVDMNDTDEFDYIYNVEMKKNVPENLGNFMWKLKHIQIADGFIKFLIRHENLFFKR